MHRNVIAAVLIVAGLAAARELTPMPQPGTAAPLGAVKQKLDPRIEALHQQMASADKAGNTDEVKRIGCEVQRILLDQQQPARPLGEFTRPATKAPARRPADGPDVVIHSGYVLAHATDYEMDGTMWTAVSDGTDSTVSIYKSTDHGQTWIYYWGFYTIPKSPLAKLELVVGVPDSGFIYTFFIHPNNDGDLRVARMGRDTVGYVDLAINVGTDTVTDFSACRDYSGGNYWLYATSHNGLRPGDFPPSRIFRSTDYAKNWAGVQDFYNLSRPMMQAGAGKYIYLSAVLNQTYWKGQVGNAYSKSYGEPGSWATGGVYQPDTFSVYDASIAPAFTEPDSEAVVWMIYSHKTDDAQWDALFTYRNGVADPWHAPGVLSGDTAVDEAYLDVRPYTETGNPWVNASYCHMPGTPDNIYREFANSGTPENWSEPLQINAGDIAYGVNYRPRLCYSPGAPGTGAGCVFPSADRAQLKWNSPWYVGVEERPTLDASRRVQATVVRGVLRLPAASPATHSSLLSIDGRKVMPLQPGLNDVQHLARGVYYVVRGAAQPAVKVVLQ